MKTLIALSVLTIMNQSIVSISPTDEEKEAAKKIVSCVQVAESDIKKITTLRHGPLLLKNAGLRKTVNVMQKKRRLSNRQ